MKEGDRRAMVGSHSCAGRIYILFLEQCAPPLREKSLRNGRCGSRQKEVHAVGPPSANGA